RNDFIVAKTKRGLEVLRVVKGTYEISKDNIVESDGEFLRLATEEDFITYKENDKKAEEAMNFCQSAISDENLEMRLVNAKYTLDMNKQIFNCTSDKRVDFIRTVRTIAKKFKTRNEIS